MRHRMGAELVTARQRGATALDEDASAHRVTSGDGDEDRHTRAVTIDPDTVVAIEVFGTESNTRPLAVGRAK